MKTIIICAICQKPKKFSDSYAVKITSYTKIPTTLNGVTTMTSAGTTTEKARACRTCIKRMGYKVKTSVKKPIKK